MLTKRTVLAAKVEGTYNTDAVPAAATDAVLVEDVKWSLSGLRFQKRNPVRASLATLKSVYAGTLIDISFAAPMKGSGAAGTVPEVDALLQACGFAVTTVASTSNTYKPVSDPAAQKSATLYLYEDGQLIKITGAVGKPSFDAQAGQTGKLSFTFTGHFVSITTVALPAATYDSTVEPPCINAAFSVDAYSAVISKLSIDCGIEISTPDSIAAADGYGRCQIIGRAVTGSIDPERPALGTYDFLAKLQSGAVMALDTGVVGATAGNRWRIQLPAITYTELSPGDRSGVRTYDTKFEANESTTDDEISIIYT